MVVSLTAVPVVDWAVAHGEGVANGFAAVKQRKLQHVLLEVHLLYDQIRSDQIRSDQRC